MDNKGSTSEKTQVLTNAYQQINDEGRDVLDKVVQKMEKISCGSDKTKCDEAITYLSSLKQNPDIC